MELTHQSAVWAIANMRPGKRNECWPYLGWKLKTGYGGITLKEGNYSAHRTMWMIHNNRTELARNEYICHHCDNPACVNPHHLYLGNHRTNTMDSVSRDRNPKGSKNKTSKLNEHMVSEIKERYVAGVVSWYELADEYGVCASTIGCVLSGTTWKHVRPDLSETLARTRSIRDKSHRR